MLRLRDISLERKLKLITAVSSGAALFITCAGFVTYDYVTFRKTLSNNVAAFAQLIADQSAFALDADYRKDINDFLKSDLGNHPHIIGVCVYKTSNEATNNQVFTLRARPGSEETFDPPPRPASDRKKDAADRLLMYRPIVVDGERRGMVYVESDLEELKARLWWNVASAVGLMVGALAAAFVLSSQLQRMISRPLLLLAEAVRTISREKQYSHRVPRAEGRDELMLLIDGFNEMLGQIERRDDALRETHGQLERRVEERTHELQLEISERKQAEKIVQQQLARISLLNRITHAIAERQDVQSILSVVLHQVEQHFAVSCGAFYLFDSEKRVLNLSAMRSKDPHDPACRLASSVELSDIEAGQLRGCLEGITVYLPDAQMATLPVGADIDCAVRSLVAVPLMVENELFGLLLTTRSDIEGFSSGDCEFLKMLCEQVALAGHHAQLYTELQGAYDELRQTQQAVMQHERLRALGQMASGIAHDINNALSPVMGFSELLIQTEHKLSPAGARYLRHIQTSSEDIAHIVSRLREFYRQREDAHELKPVMLNLLVPQVVELTRPRWRDMSQERGVPVQVKVELAGSCPPVLGVESELREALTNLVLNAVDALPKGGVITVRTREGRMQANGSSEFIAEVCDTGIGMDEETRKRCLEPFFSTKGVRGTGLGLAMVYGIMERHDSRIEIDSEPGKGTTMRLVFPVREHRSEGDTPASEEPPPLASLRVLFVDDEPLLRQLVQGILEHDHHHVTTADSGEKGLALFRDALNKEPFDVVITDLGMPGLDGRKLTGLLKQASPPTPVIMLTGWGSLMRTDGESPTQVDCVLSKPPRIKELRNALRQTLQARSTAAGTIA